MRTGDWGLTSTQYLHWQASSLVVRFSGTSMRHSLHRTYSSGWGAAPGAAPGAGEDVREGERGAKEAALACSEYLDEEARERMLEHREHTLEGCACPEDGSRSRLTGLSGSSRGSRRGSRRGSSSPVVRHFLMAAGCGCESTTDEERGSARSRRNCSTL